MAETGASLQNTNNELVKSIEELREKRAECDRCITKEEEEKARIVHELQILTERLRRIDEGISVKCRGSWPPFSVRTRLSFFLLLFENDSAQPPSGGPLRPSVGLHVHSPKTAFPFQCACLPRAGQAFPHEDADAWCASRPSDMSGSVRVVRIPLPCALTCSTLPFIVK